MSASTEAYPAYKPSEVPWLGAVPEHWGLLPAFACYKPKEIRNEGMQETTVLSLSYGRLVVKHAEKLHGLVPASFATYQIVDPEDIIIRGTDLQNDHTSLRVGISPHRGIITSAYLCLRTQYPMTAEYGYRLLSAWDLSKSIYGYGSGLRQSLDFGDFRRMRVPVPPAAEQAGIVRYLAAIDAHIGALTRNRRRLIQLLNEQKQAIINRVVARGLDPNVRMKPSGVQWLGEVPEHWDVVRIGHCIEMKTGYAFKSSGFTDSYTDTRLLRGVNVTPGRIRWGSVVRWPTAAAEHLSEFALREGDLVFGMDRPVIGSGIRVATVMSSDVPSLLVQRVARLRAVQGVRQDYLGLLLQDNRYADYLAAIPTGISVPHVSPAQIAAYSIALPPLPEQDTILEHLRRETHPLGLAIARAENMIHLIREYRTRLICDVVTGKLDVRGVDLPEIEDGDLIDTMEAGLDGYGEDMEELGVSDDAEDGHD